jgi:amino acid adenylation domain-containing protein
MVERVATHSQATVPSVFERQVDLHGDALAVRAAGRTLSYRELDAHANRVARELMGRGVGTGGLVGVLAERGIETVVGVLGALKSGAAYMPLDPESPRLRTKQLLEHAGAQALLAPAHLAASVPADGRPLLVLDGTRRTLESEDFRRVGVASRPEDLFAVLFTSGSTGAPKPIALEHRNLLNLLAGAPDLLPRPGESALHVCAPQFDMATYEIWATLLSGASLVCQAPGRPDPREIAATLQVHGVRWAAVPTSIFEQLVQSGPGPLACLRMLLVGGEPMSPRSAASLKSACPATRLMNIYGPAETTILVAAHEVESEAHLEEERVPVGRSVAGSRLWILDERLQPVSRGRVGELCIGGPGLSRGYLHRPRRTYAANATDPISGERLHRSGDLARERDDGAIEVLGRIDRQVKISGYRVQPAEIEAVLAGAPGVGAAAVLAREDVPGHRRLVAYVTRTEDDAGASLDEARLRELSRQRLPSYMVPSSFVTLEQMPLSANGKADLAALPDPPAKRTAGGLLKAWPQDVLQVASTFAEVLCLDAVDPDEDFFELGGNSLLAVKVLVRLGERLGIDLPIAAVFEARTAAGLAGRLRLQQGAAASVAALPPLRPRTSSAPVSATPGQAKALLIGELADESLPYQSQALFRILGSLDLAALERALSEMVRRHEILRTTFVRRGGTWTQVVHKPTSVTLTVQDLSGAADIETSLWQTVERLCRTRLDPARLPLARWSLLHLGAHEHVLLSLEHHVVHDGVSTALFLRELAVIYTAQVEKRAAALPAPSVQYRDFAAWQASLVESERGRHTLDHWRTRLAGAPETLELPFDRPRPVRQTYRGQSLRLTLPEDLAQELRRRGRQWGASTFMVMLAAYCCLLARYADAEEVVVGSGLANRRTLGSEELIGMVVNTVALRIDLSGDPPLEQVLARVREAVLDAQSHQDIPFERVVEHLAPARAANVAPLYQALFSFHDSPVRSTAVPGAVIVPHDALPNGSAKADLSVVVIDRPGSPDRPAEQAGRHWRSEEGLTVVWEYNEDLFERASAERMLGHYRRVLEQFACAEQRTARTLAICDEHERRAVLALAGASGGEIAASLAELFQAQAAARPHATAVTFEGQALEYSRLERWSNRLAHRLHSMGVAPGTRVGVCMDRSFELIVALLAIVKAGAVYVPLDPTDPSERLGRHVGSLRISLLLTLRRNRDRVPVSAAEVMCLDDELDLSREPDSPPHVRTGAADTVYVMFTSGSSGDPKGVEVPNRAVVSLVRDVDYVRLGAGETVLGLAPVAFDASTFEIWGALLNGATLALAPPGPLSTGELLTLVREQNVSVIWLTAGLFHRVVDDRPELLSTVGQLLAGGEVLSPDHVARALQALPDHGVLINGYGPTETTTFACAHQMRPGDAIGGSVPIGRPVAGRRIYILQESGEPAPPGVPGEIFIGGAGVALGYASDPQASAERFLADPFAGDPQARMYRSGDRGRWRSDGTIEFLGRRDRQLKIRGFRVEPGEVEHALRGHPDVADACVTVMRAERSAGGAGLLAAHIVPRAGCAPDAADLRAHVARLMPAYAVPAAWSSLERLPLTRNGKVDLSALPEPVLGVGQHGRAGSEEQTQAAAPAGRHAGAPDALERKLLALWRQTLEIDDVHPDQDFFDLGGHSLLAVELFEAIELRLGMRLPLASIFEAPTVRQLAALLREEGWDSPRGSLVALRASGRRPPLFFVAAGDGNSVGFGALARRLGPDQPFYALQPRGIDGGARLHGSVEAMAKHYLRAIRAVTPDGPYLLGGRCLGALVAYEMARRLRAGGARVDLLLALDSGGPLWRQRELADGTPFDEVMSSALRRPEAPIEIAQAFTTEGTQTLLRWLSETVLEGADGTPINRYLEQVYSMRSDVRDIYPDLAGKDALWFLGWAWTNGRQQLQLTERLLPPPADPKWREPITPTGLRGRLAEASRSLAWRTHEALDLATRERGSQAAARHAARVRDMSLRAWYDYRAGPYDGTVTLVRSEEFGVQPLLERWHVLETAGVVERRVRGTHRSMLREPDVACLAECVAELVEQSMRRCASQDGLEVAAAGRRTRG